VANTLRVKCQEFQGPQLKAWVCKRKIRKEKEAHITFLLKISMGKIMNHVRSSR
jgi:hypothetical protein